MICCGHEKFKECFLRNSKIVIIDLIKAISEGDYDLQAISLDFIVSLIKNFSKPHQEFLLHSVAGIVIQSLSQYIKHDSEAEFLFSILTIIAVAISSDKNDTRILQLLLDHDLVEAIDNIAVR